MGMLWKFSRGMDIWIAESLWLLTPDYFKEPSVDGLESTVFLKMNLKVIKLHDAKEKKKRQEIIRELLRVQYTTKEPTKDEWAWMNFSKKNH